MSVVRVPQHVLPEALASAIGDRRLVSAVFVTFQLEPGFFEDAVLPPILGCETGHGDRVLRALVEDRLRDLDDEVVVFYDRSGLIVDRTPRQAVSAVPVTWMQKILHAKHALLLVRAAHKDDGSAGTESLILLTTSANLTRSGWWENVEVADIEELAAGSQSSLKPDLVGLLAILRDLDRRSDHRALGRLETFVGGLTSAPGLPRLWIGDEPLPTFLANMPGLARPGQVEIVAPYVGADATPVRELHKALQPREIWVRLPTDRDDAPEATEAWRDDVAALDGARFAELPATVDQSLGRGTSGKRFVHAKVVRVVSADRRRAWSLAGSPNLTNAAFAGRERGNFETAMLRELPVAPDWLRPLGAKPRGAAERAKPPEERPPWTFLRLRLRYDWQGSRASYLLEDDGPADVGLGRAGAGAAVAFTFRAEPADDWQTLPQEVGAWMRAELVTTNLVRIRTGHDEPMPVLIEEVGRNFRPDFLHQALTPADILRYWSLRDVASREAHLERLVTRTATTDGDVGPAMVPEASAHTMFDSFAGLFHAFLCLRERLDELLLAGRDQAVVARLLGNGHDALPTLLEKVLSGPDTDRVQQLLTLLSAQEVVSSIRQRRPDLFAAHPAEVASLQAHLDQTAEVWSGLDLGGGSPADIDPALFRDWFTTSWPTEVA